MITKADMTKAKLWWFVQLIVPLFRVILSKFFYSISYYFRVWIRITYYNYHNITLTEGGYYPRKNVSGFEAWIATFFWWFLDDDAGEYADCGGTEFVEKYLHNNIGQIRDPEKLGGWCMWGMVIEENITNPFRRFYCAYRWNGIRNPAYNFNRKYMIPDLTEPIETLIVYGNDPDPWKQCRFKDKRNLIDFYHSRFGKKYVFFKGANGKTVFAWSKAVLVANEKKGTLIAYAKKFGWSLPYIRHTFSIRKYKHKLTGKDRENYKKRYLFNMCGANCKFVKFKCDKCEL